MFTSVFDFKAALVTSSLHSSLTVTQLLNWCLAHSYLQSGGKGYVVVDFLQECTESYRYFIVMVYYMRRRRIGRTNSGCIGDPECSVSDS